MKILMLLVLAIPAFSQKVLKVRGDTILISNDDIELEEGKKYYIETESGEALIGTYTNASTGSGYVAKILDGEVAEGDRIAKYTKKKIGGGSVSRSHSGPYKKFQWGFHGGLNQFGTKTVDGNGKTLEESDAELGFQGGLVLQYNINEKFGINTKLSYNTFKASKEDKTTIPGQVITDYLSLSTITLQPTATFRVVKFLDVFAGVRVGMAMSLVQTTEDANGNELPIYNGKTEFDALDEQNQKLGKFEVSKIGLDIPLGIGLNFDLGNISLRPNFTYYLPLGALVESTDPNDVYETTYSNMAFNLDVLF